MYGSVGSIDIMEVPPHFVLSVDQRYWKVDLWKDFFDTLINFKGDHVAGACSLAALRQRFEAYFEVN